MNTDQPASTSRISVKDFIVVAGSVVASAFVIGSAVRSDGSRGKQVEDNTRRIEILEHADQAKTDLLTKIDGRTIRIETKLEMMAPAPRETER